MCAYYVYQKIQVNQYKKTSKKDIGRGGGSAIVKFFDELIDLEKQTAMKGLFNLNFEFGPLA